MTLNPQELLIGSVFISYGGLDLGLTTDEGITYKPQYETAKFKGSQAIVTLHKQRTAVSGMISAQIAQMTLENWRYLEDLENAPSGGTLQGRYKVRPTERQLVITGPAPNGGTRVLTATASISSMGEVKWNNKDYQSFPVEFELLGVAETNELWTVVDTASSESEPNASSYQKIISAVESEILDGATGINVGAALQATFPVAIRGDQLNSSKFILKATAGNSFVSCAVAYGETAGSTDYTKVKVTPAANLTALTEYELIIVPGVLSQDAVPGDESSIQFTTA